MYTYTFIKTTCLWGLFVNNRCFVQCCFLLFSVNTQLHQKNEQLENYEKECVLLKQKVSRLVINMFATIFLFFLIYTYLSSLYFHALLIFERIIFAPLIFAHLKNYTFRALLIFAHPKILLFRAPYLIFISSCVVSEVFYIKVNTKMFKGEFRAEFFFKKLHSSYSALKCQKNPFCFILIIFSFRSYWSFKIHKFSWYRDVIVALANFQKTHLSLEQHKFCFKAWDNHIYSVFVLPLIKFIYLEISCSVYSGSFP